ncbi:ABC transporter ATP-binding protein [Natrinema sp. CBA1119]|uniref:ABC transporter ATP-binding protein n=1 Tax=Natrinema sp. CBA1119 TaxID=1608465 RepID=UPI0031B5D653
MSSNSVGRLGRVVVPHRRPSSRTLSRPPQRSSTAIEHDIPLIIRRRKDAYEPCRRPRHRNRRTDETVRRDDRRLRPDDGRRAGNRLRVSRSERRGEDDHDADTDDADETDSRDGPRRRPLDRRARVRYPTHRLPPRGPPVYDELTGREQLEYAAGLRDMPDAEASERIESLLERFDLLEDANKRIEDYSKGMRQKVGVIQAVLHEPEVAFLDEPTSGLDPRAARTMRDTIADLADREMTIFLSTHILPVVDELADEIGVLHDGKLVAEGDPETLKTRAETGDARSLEDAFLEITRDPGEEGLPREQAAE